MRRHRAWLILTLATAICATPALAQKPPAAPAGTAKQADSTDEKVRALFKEGNKHYRAKKWAEAEAAFEAAWALTDKKSKGIVNNLGQTKIQLKKYREAAELLSIARRLADKNDKQLADIERDLSEAKKYVGTLVITASVDGAQVLLDDKPVGLAPLPDPLFVEPGKMTIRAVKDGESAQRELEVTAGQEIQVPLALLKPQPPPPTATATAPPTATPPPTETFVPPPLPPPPPPPSKLPGLVFGGAGVLSVIIGSALLGAAHGAGGDIQARSEAIAASGTGCPVDPRCTELEGAARGGDSMSRAGVGLLVGGVVMAAAGGAYLLWISRRPQGGSVGLVPVASPQGAGLFTTGSF